MQKCIIYNVYFNLVEQLMGNDRNVINAWYLFSTCKKTLSSHQSCNLSEN